MPLNPTDDHPGCSVESSDFSNYLTEQKNRVDHCLEQFLSHYTDNHSPLARAMRYSTLLGGKRIRPMMVLATAECVGVDPELAIAPACAVEMIHAYSLVHDDLPAMDDDDLRRGQATCHKAFDEATAILAGDAMQTMAFSIIANDQSLTDSSKLSMISRLADASGAKGMVLGQAIDLASEGQALDLSALENMHRHKTGKLIVASIMLGAMCNPDIGASDLSLFENYAKAVGLAFQVQDDILDIVSDTETLGKQQGSDTELDKATYPKLLGLEGARLKARELLLEAETALAGLSQFDTRVLHQLSQFAVTRSN